MLPEFHPYSMLLFEVDQLLRSEQVEVSPHQIHLVEAKEMLGIMFRCRSTNQIQILWGQRGR